MNLRQALVYFLREAFVSLARSWKISLVAVTTIGLSLFLCGFFVMVASNVSESILSFGEDAKVIVYLRAEADEGAIASLAEEIASADWVTSVARVSAAEAGERFERHFPDLAGLLEGTDSPPLPASLEASLGDISDESALEEWLDRLRDRPVVDLVDDDRDWLRQVGTVVAVARALGLALGAALLAAAVFTTASVIRLIAYLYLDEIAVMRLVGATEFYIRGPFWAEGLLQGLLGGVAGLVSLYVTAWLVRTSADGGLWLSMLTSEFLSYGQQALLVLIGGAAGLLGAVLSLRREQLSAEPLEAS